MKTVTIISGKGGTGKTSIVASLAVLAKNAVFADCDVDAAALSILLDGQVSESHEFRASQKAFVDPILCTHCGLCGETCHLKPFKKAQLISFYARDAVFTLEYVHEKQS